MNDVVTHDVGTGVLIISPTRELAMQTYGVAREILKYHHHTHGIIMGGARRPAEVDKLTKGHYHAHTQ